MLLNTEYLVSIVVIKIKKEIFPVDALWWGSYQICAHITLIKLDRSSIFENYVRE